MDFLRSSSIQGKVRCHQIIDDVWTPCSDFKSNLVLYDWAKITAKLLTSGDAKYRIGGMYLEFENTASPGDTVSAPTFDRTRSITYYNGLSGSASRDYLRVPLTATQLLSEGEGLTDNQIVFFARSSGVTGVHGKTFSDSANSVIFGASLVAFVDSTDATQDILLSSFYFSTGDQQQKLATSQIGIEWELTLQ